MNREIKFRAWDGKKMHYKVNILSNWGAIKEGYSATAWNDESKAGIPMQFTGLTDKNGKEIYEGDIVKLTQQHESYIPDSEETVDWESTSIGEVIYEYGEFIVKNEPLSLYKWVQRGAKIIGNIYENPELIK